MATYTKETALYDTGAIAGDIANAGTTATNYITYVSATDGIKVHNANDTSNYAQINSDGMNVVKGGVSVAEFGETSRVGKAGSNSSHIMIDSDSVDIHNYGVRNLEISGSTTTDGVFGRLQLAPDSLSGGNSYARIRGGRRSTPAGAEIEIAARISEEYDYAQLAIESSTKGPYVNVHGTFKVAGDASVSGDLTVQNHSSPVGTLLSATSSVAITTANINTYSIGPSLTLDPGSYIVRGVWAFNSVSGARVTDVDLATDNSTSATASPLSRVRVSNANGAWVRLEAVAPLSITSQTTVYVKGSATVTSTAQACVINAIRIA